MTYLRFFEGKKTYSFKTAIMGADIACLPKLV